MQDYSLDRFGELLENLKAQKSAEQEEGDERSVSFNEARGGNTDNMMDSMM